LQDALALLDREFLGCSGIPLIVMLDHVDADALGHGAPSSKARTDEEHKLFQLIQQRRSDQDVEPVVFSPPDIICALPSAAIARAFPSAQPDGNPIGLRGP
jgi:hypothetical protein